MGVVVGSLAPVAQKLDNTIHLKENLSILSIGFTGYPVRIALSNI